MMVKLTPAVNFTNILQAAFAPISFTNTNLSRIYKKAAQKTFVEKAARKMLVKLAPGRSSSTKVLARINSSDKEMTNDIDVEPSLRVTNIIKDKMETKKLNS